MALKERGKLRAILPAYKFATPIFQVSRANFFLKANSGVQRHMSYTSGTSGLSSYSSTPDGSKSIIRLEIPEPDPLSKPKSLCAGTECIALTLLVGIVIIVVCVIAQISVIAEANTVLSQVRFRTETVAYWRYLVLQTLLGCEASFGFCCLFWALFFLHWSVLVLW